MTYKFRVADEFIQIVEKYGCEQSLFIDKVTL